MSAIAVIPARGGSKRIPKKNIKDFLGKPLIAYSIETAKNSGLFDEIVVSTDSEEIAAVARKYGAITPFLRDKSLSDEFTGTYAVVKDAYFKLKDKYNPDYVCCIYATAPLLRAKYLTESIEILKNSDSLSLTSICEFSFPIQRAFIKDDKQIISYREPQYAMSRSQDLEKCYQDCGQFYWYKKERFYADSDNKRLGYCMPSYRVMDIDTPEDWDYACAMAKIIKELNLE